MTNKVGYSGARSDLISICNLDLNGKTVVDFGCYCGANAEWLKEHFDGIYYIGFEYDMDAINNMSPLSDQTVQMNLDEFNAGHLHALPKVDLVILGDVLEHLKNPEVFLDELRKAIDINTVVIVSIPNIQYYETILLLLLGCFPRRERGIFDKTHVRWFTYREFSEMIKGMFKIESFHRKYRLIERPSRINLLTPLFYPLILFLKPFFTFQMQFVLRKR
jgi:2-polyprenyl-3-methyl-5-hydroxy-6-metoxy-1,4-benzoquinol methylase